MIVAVVALLLLLPGLAAAQVADECLVDGAAPSKPGDYDEQVQQDFLANYVALATTFSAIHAPVPHEPGRGALGVDVGVIPPLGCARRFVLDHTKTEDTNKAPAAPRLRATYAFPAVGALVPYVGLGFLPPVPLPDAANPDIPLTNTIISGEIGAGATLRGRVQLGGRFHATSHVTSGEIATPFQDGDPAFRDRLVANTMGLDLMGGYVIHGVFTPYAAVGVTDASTFFYVGDDGAISNNAHPYAGLTFSVGLDGLVKDRLRWGAELYGAPGGHWGAAGAAGRDYGSLYTGRIRLGLEL